MRNTKTVLLLVAMLGGLDANACDPESGAREQQVVASWGGERLAVWDGVGGDIKALDLPNGFRLGVRIDEPDPEVYREATGGGTRVPELVEITLFDLDGTSPVQLSRTFGGANSLHGFGSRGGANRVDALGDPGVLLILHKPICAASR